MSNTAQHVSAWYMSICDYWNFRANTLVRAVVVVKRLEYAFLQLKISMIEIHSTPGDESVVLCGPLWSSVHLTSWVPRSACFWETNLAPKQKMLQWQHEKLVWLGWSSSPSRALQVSQSRSCTSDYDLKFKQCLSRCCPTRGANKNFNQNFGK